MNINLLAKKLPFRKMHGLENDFVVLDARQKEIILSKSEIIAIADRRAGIGFDQLLIIQPSQKSTTRCRARAVAPPKIIGGWGTWVGFG